MSRILVPYISQKHLDHKYFTYSKNLDGNVESYRTISTGLYSSNDKELEWLYSLIFELVVLYDEILITKEDYYYLLTKIDNGFLNDLLSSGILTLVNTDSFRFGCSLKDKELMFMADSSPTNVGFSSVLDSLSGSKVALIEKCTMNFDNEKGFINTIISESNNDLANPTIKKYVDFKDVAKENDIYLHNYRANRIFYMNYFYALQAKLNVESVYQDQILYDLLRMKVDSNLKAKSISLEDGFRKILEFNDILDINRLVYEGKISLNSLIELREHKDCKHFREWLGGTIETSSVEGADIIKAYHHACIANGKFGKVFDSSYYKPINVSLSVGLGLIPVIGGVYAVFDNYKDFIFKDWKPHCFINRIQSTIDKHQGQ